MIKKFTNWIKSFEKESVQVELEEIKSESFVKRNKKEEVGDFLKDYKSVEHLNIRKLQSPQLSYSAEKEATGSTHSWMKQYGAAHGMAGARGLTGAYGCTGSSGINLKEAIVIKTEFKYSHPDLIFIGNSKIDLQPIYRYTGTNFSSFVASTGLKYEELFSIR